MINHYIIVINTFVSMAIPCMLAHNTVVQVQACGDWCRVYKTTYKLHLGTGQVFFVCVQNSKHLFDVSKFVFTLRTELFFCPLTHAPTKYNSHCHKGVSNHFFSSNNYIVL